MYCSVYRQCGTFYYKARADGVHIRFSAANLTELRAIAAKKNITLKRRVKAKLTTNVKPRLHRTKAQTRAKARATAPTQNAEAKVQTAAKAKPKPKAKPKGQAKAKAKAKAKGKARAAAQTQNAEAKAEVQTASTAKPLAKPQGQAKAKARPKDSGKDAPQAKAQRKAQANSDQASADQAAADLQASTDRAEADEAEQVQAAEADLALQAVLSQLPRTKIVIRSHMRPLYAAKTAKLMKQMWEGDLQVFVEGSLLSEYSRIFALEGVDPRMLAEGALGCGPQVAAAQCALAAEGGGHLVILDDNLCGLRLCDLKVTKLAFGAFLGHAWRMMLARGCGAWSAAPCSNTFGNIVAMDAKGKFGLRLLYGACFGVRVGPNQHHTYFNCIHGNIHDDLERSCRTEPIECMSEC
jgi:hypothetical protein